MPAGWTAGEGGSMIMLGTARMIGIWSTTIIL
jgi:hypothetical protein